MLRAAGNDRDEGALTDLTDALRATSDAMLRDLDGLGTLEDEKRGIEPSDPRMLDLADRIEEIARRVLAGSRNQRELTEDIAGTAAPGATAPAIDDTRRSVQAILAEWRAAERRLAVATRGSPEALEAETLVEHAREAYRAAYEAAQDRRDA
jgi:hypothetical protein